MNEDRGPPRSAAEALALHRAGRLVEAEAAYRDMLAREPSDAGVLAYLGTALHQQGRRDEAIDMYRRAIALQPGNADAHTNLGVALKELGRLEEAVAAYRAAIAADPRRVEAHSNLGNALRELGRLDESIAACRNAIEVAPASGEARLNLGVAFKEAGRLEEAGAALREACRLAPNSADAHANLGAALMRQGKLDEAAAAYARAAALRPEDVDAVSQLMWLRQAQCDWREFDADQARLIDFIARGKRLSPYTVLFARTSLAEQARCAARWAEQFRVPRERQFAHARRGDSGRIRVGYLSADFHLHATAYLTAELFERHDRGRLEVTGYSFGPDDKSAMRARLVSAFEHFVDLRTVSHGDAARRIHADGIDILVDLKGYTSGARTAILAPRPAPIQVNFLGYPGTMGADFVDYVLADATVAPMADQPQYAEKIVHLPDCYQPNDRMRAIAEPAPTRAQCGLPERGFVFCSFNNSQKLTPGFFAIWMRLLKAVPGSVLWLLGTGATIEANLRREAHSRGVAPERLVFAPMIGLAEHLARYRHADLFLDTLPYNGHTTASDALWAGVPVLTCAGPTFAGRVAASLLKAVGLPELTTASAGEYEALALRLATEPALLTGLRRRLAANRATAPLFDAARFARGIEAAYARMWEIWRAGRPPEPFAVAPQAK